MDFSRKNFVTSEQSARPGMFLLRFRWSHSINLSVSCYLSFRVKFPSESRAVLIRGWGGVASGYKGMGCGEQAGVFNALADFL